MVGAPAALRCCAAPGTKAGPPTVAEPAGRGEGEALRSHRDGGAPHPHRVGAGGRGRQADLLDRVHRVGHGAGQRGVVGCARRRLRVEVVPCVDGAVRRLHLEVEVVHRHRSRAEGRRRVGEGERDVQRGAGGHVDRVLALGQRPGVAHVEGGGVGPVDVLVPGAGRALALGVVEVERVPQVHQAEALPGGRVLTVERALAALRAGVEAAHAIGPVDHGRPHQCRRGVRRAAGAARAGREARRPPRRGGRAGAGGGVAVEEVLADQGGEAGEEGPGHRRALEDVLVVVRAPLGRHHDLARRGEVHTEVAALPGTVAGEAGQRVDRHHRLAPVGGRGRGDHVAPDGGRPHARRIRTRVARRRDDDHVLVVPHEAIGCLSRAQRDDRGDEPVRVVVGASVLGGAVVRVVGRVVARRDRAGVARPVGLAPELVVVGRSRQPTARSGDVLGHEAGRGRHAVGAVPRAAGAGVADHRARHVGAVRGLVGRVRPRRPDVEEGHHLAVVGAVGLDRAQVDVATARSGGDLLVVGLHASTGPAVAEVAVRGAVRRRRVVDRGVRHPGDLSRAVEPAGQGGVEEVAHTRVVDPPGVGVERGQPALGLHPLHDRQRRDGRNRRGGGLDLDDGTRGGLDGHTPDRPQCGCQSWDAPGRRGRRRP